MSRATQLYAFSNLRVLDGGGSVAATGFDDSSVGAFTYTLPAAETPRPVHIGYTVSDGTNTANGIVTLQLVGIVANSANFSVLQNAPSTLPALDGRVIDVESDPTFDFLESVGPHGRRHGRVHRHGQGDPQLHSAQRDLHRHFSDSIHRQRRYELDERRR